jgi:hypothetical protein
MPSALTKPVLPALKTPSLPTLDDPRSAVPNELKPPRSALPSQLKTPRSALLNELRTPRSATLPSELPRSPAPGFLDLIKQEDDLKTPITPPTAYTQFLKALSPALSSPSSGRSSTFSEKSSGKSTPTSAPSSAGSACSCGHETQTAASAPIIPPSPFARPPNSARSLHSARTPTSLRRLRIPQSPIYSPTTGSPKSSAIRSPFSPAEWFLDGKSRYYESPRTGCYRPVSVRQVVTRTVTYTRTPLDPAPKGKRRKLE